MLDERELIRTLPILAGIVKSISGTAASSAVAAQGAAEKAQQKAESAAETAQQHAWGVSVSQQTLTFTAPTNP